MEDKTYNTSITKKRMVFLAVREIRGPGATKLIAEVLRAFKKAINETEDHAMKDRRGELEKLVELNEREQLLLRRD
jgi:hypothetical protein